MEINARERRLQNLENETENETEARRANEASRRANQREEARRQVQANNHIEYYNEPDVPSH